MDENIFYLPNVDTRLISEDNNNSQNDDLVLLYITQETEDLPFDLIKFIVRNKGKVVVILAGAGYIL